MFKRQWAGLFFGGGGGPAAGPAPRRHRRGGAAGRAPAGPDPARAGGSTRPAAASPRDVCAAYLRIATTGRADAGAVALLRRSSPAAVLDRIKAPTLLIQGEADSLFPLGEADANARGIAADRHPGAGRLVHRRPRRRRRPAVRLRTGCSS